MEEARTFTRLAAPLDVGPMRVKNRIMMAPMERNYGHPDGSPSERTIAHYARIARGGVGWIDVESTFVDPAGRGRTHQLGLHDDASIPGFRRLAEAARGHDVRIGVELHHAGRNTSPAISGTTPVAPSPVECPEAGSGTPHELTREQIGRIVRRYAEAAARAVEAGFDAVELHSAHGYLPLAFLSPLTNLRTDEYGGDLAGRARFPLEVLDACRAAWPDHKPLSVRISAVDWAEGGFTNDDAVALAGMLAEHGCDLVDVSSGQVWADQRPEFGRSYQTPFADRIRNEAGIATMAVGAISSPEDVNTIVLSGRADLCALGRPHLHDPYWTLHAAAEQGYAGVEWVAPYRAGSRRPVSGRTDAVRMAPRSFVPVEEVRPPARWRPPVRV